MTSATVCTKAVVPQLALVLFSVAAGCANTSSGGVDARGPSTDGGARDAVPLFDVARRDGSAPDAAGPAIPSYRGVFARAASGLYAAFPSSVAVDGVGNTYLTGAFAGTGTLGSFVLSAPYDPETLFVAKLDAQGRPLWVRQTTGAHRSAGSAIAVSPDGRAIYVAGGFIGEATLGAYAVKSVPAPPTVPDVLPDDMLLAELSPDGEVRWLKRFGGDAEEWPHALAVTREGDLILGGSCSSTAHFDAERVVSAGSSDICVARLSPTGQVRWVVRGGGPNTDLLTSLAVGPSGGVYLGGQFYGEARLGPQSLLGQGAYDGFVAKLSPAGDFLWARGFGGAGSYDEARAVALDAHEEALFMTGRFSEQMVVGSTRLKCSGLQDLMLARFSAGDGRPEWAVAVGGPAADAGNGLVVGASGALFVTGTFEEMLVHGPATLNAVGAEDLLLGAFTLDGKLAWLRSAGGLGNDGGYALASGPGKALHLAGQFRGTLVLDGTTLVSPGLNFFAWKLLPE
ncbi:MAG: hypothetical protein IT371_31050 [Deltaproteobacteria bacterium]|nr:hypothetical protein [Deltaproteobacteria bacterium]